MTYLDRADRRLSPLPRPATGQRERERWAELAEGQSPKVMVIACSDSRVDPAQIFDARPGEMFVVRNIAALVPPFETSSGFHGVSAALEFAVTQLEVDEIVVMGHGLCGGCAAALTGQFDDTEHGEGHFIADWVGCWTKRATRSGRAIQSSIAAAFLEMEREAVKVSLANLRTFPWIAERETGRQAEAPRRALLDRRGAPLHARRGGR